MENLIIDVDGNKYKTVQIGNQIWMAENLRVTHFANGDEIQVIEDDKEWEKAGHEKKPATCCFQNKPANEKTYGKLYNWFSVTDPRGLAPEGWHIPTEEEWKELENFVGKRDAGTKLKSTEGWHRKKNGTNETGFNGLPGGDRSWNGVSESDDLKRFVYWYSFDSNFVAGIKLEWNFDKIILFGIGKSMSGECGYGTGLYVRCIKNK